MVAQEVADGAVYMHFAPLNVSVKALDVVPSGECLLHLLSQRDLGLMMSTAQRSLSVFDREWNKRNGQQKQG